ncbi:MAG TPA: twin-arginine translocase TatA/TatE family subunit [Polyangiaceae bacterium]|nr:twin-arginine translocase TatA/TatE family subunit [Polyangiaceae bacterium]
MPSVPHLLILLVVVLLLFGAGRLGELGKGLGEGIKNFKKGLGDNDDAEKKKPAELEAKNKDSDVT